MTDLNNFGISHFHSSESDVASRVRSDPLFHPAWVDFNERRWGLTAEIIELGDRRAHV